MTDRGGTCDYIARKEDPSNWHGEDPGDWVLENEVPVGLEQEVWECPHDALDGAEYCPFHTDPEDVPDDVDEGERFIEAVNESSAVDDEETARRRKEFVGATFGAFDIEEATLDGGEEHPIRLDHARFARGVNAENAVFEQTVLATWARFEAGDGETTDEIGKTSFREAEFGDGEVSFREAEFGDGEVSFREAEFGDGEVSFVGAEFGDGEVSFVGAEFGDGEVSFREAEFGDGEVSFGEAEFGDGEVSFVGAEFGDGEVSFQEAEFGNRRVSFLRADFGDGLVLFSFAEFGNGEVSFRLVEFGDGSVSFSFAEFGDGKVSLSFAEFGDGKVSLSYSQFGDGEVSFQNSEFGDGEVSFQNSEFGDGEVSFESATVVASLSFLDTRFDAKSRLSLADGEFGGDVKFGSRDDASVPYMQHPMDFSGATFRRALEFRDGIDSTTSTEQSEQEAPQFDVVFAGDVDFSDVTFPDGVDFSATRFPPDADFTGATLEDADFSGADVTGADDISEASFDGANLTGANFSRAELAGASFERARLSRAELLGTNFAGAKLYGALLGDARINRGTEFWLAEDDHRREPDGSPGPVRALRRVKMAVREREPYCPYDPRYRGSDGEPNLEKAGEVYTTLETLARNNSLPGLASECFLGRKDVQLREYWRDGDTGMVVRSLTPNLVARYGESPARVLGTGAVTVLACGLLYNAFDLVEHADSGNPATLFESLYFSGLTFTTLGYGDFTPANELGQVLAVAETSMGVVLLAILVFVFGRRATR
jgi:uncharacterized protein YjbI with pentapeptide repeats